MSTLKETIKRRLVYRLIPQYNAIVILKDDQIVRWEGPGYVRINPFTECFGPMTRTGSGSTQLVSENVRSSDRTPVSVDVKILYNFEPKQCSKEMAFAMINVGSEVLKKIIKDNCDQIIRHIAGKYTGEELCSGSVLEGFERKIRFRLRDMVKKFGVTLLEPNGVAVTISTSDELTRAYEEAAKQKAMAETQRAITEIAASMPAEGVERILRADFAKMLSKGESSINFFASGEEMLDLPSHLLRHRSSIQTNGHQNGKL
ncbi:MAG: SPFH domain-containing protein [Chloroflexi bacterium]|nr:SPFH domain-containing protein [Chloroflexota bacterium]